MDFNGIERLLKEGGLTPRGHTGSRNIFVSCIYSKERHPGGEDSSPSLSVKVNPYGPSPWICWGCKSQGTLLTLCADMHRRGLIGREVLNETIRAEPILNVVREATRKHTPIELPENFIKGRVPKYILDRGVTRSSCRKWGVGMFPDRTIAFPVITRNLKLGGLVARGYLRRHKSKYDVIAGDPNRYLYGEHWVSSWPRERGIILVEGFIDAIVSMQLGIHGVVATMGSRITDHQINTLKHITEIVMLLMDRDKPGIAFEDVLERKLVGSLRVMRFPTPFPAGKTDPKELTLDEYLDILDTGVVV